MALARARKSSLLELARHVLLDPPLVAVGALTRADVPSMTLARKEYRKYGLALKKLPNRLCELAVRSSERAFLSSIFSGDLVVLYPADDETNASTLAKRLLDGTAGASNVHLIGGALDANLLYASDFVALSELPPLSTIRAQVGRALKSPSVKVGFVLTQPSTKVGRALKTTTTKFARGLDAKARHSA